MALSDDELLALLESVESAQAANADGCSVAGTSHDDVVRWLEEAMDRGYVDAKTKLPGWGRKVAALRFPFLTPDGRAALDDLRSQRDDGGQAMPATPAKAWEELRKLAEPFSPFDRAIDEAMGELRSRGIAQSGIAITRAMQLAYDEGFTWSKAEQRFVKREPVGRRKLTSILFTDIVRSTQEAKARGDAAWKVLSNDHKALCRSLFETHGGHEVDDAGDGFLATFESASDAVACALDAVEAVTRLGIDIRAGVHVGEVETGVKPTGLSIHVASRVLNAAADATVWVTAVTAELLADDDRFEFAPQGEHELKGIDRNVALAQVSRSER